MRTLLYGERMVDEGDRVAAWAALLRTHAAVVPSLERALLPTGLPISWYDVLLVVNAAPGRRLRMTELGQQAVVSRERVSRRDRARARGARRAPGEPRRPALLLRRHHARGTQATAQGRPVHLAAIEQHFPAHLDEGRDRGPGPRPHEGAAGRGVPDRRAGQGSAWLRCGCRARGRRGWPARAGRWSARRRSGR